MNEAQLRDFLINRIEFEKMKMQKCQDQNSCYFGMCQGAMEACEDILEALDLHYPKSLVKEV